MLPVLKGLIARRILLNFRADPLVVQPMLPKPFLLDKQNGYAVVGVCLIRLEQLRPKGLPAFVGMTSENAAHRVAVQYPQNGKMKKGVFIWRRETNQRLAQLVGGRLFPGINHAARFQTKDDDHSIQISVTSSDGAADVAFSARYGNSWRPTSAFSSLQEASAFFEQGSHGFSPSLRSDRIEGMELRTLRWSLNPLDIQSQEAAFYSNSKLFPKGAVEFDCALMMRGVKHEWHKIKEVPKAEEFVAMPQQKPRARACHSPQLTR